MRALVILAIAFLLSAPAAAQTASQPAPAPVASDALEARIAELPAMLRGTGDYDAYFSADFRTAVPREKFDQITAQLRMVGGPLTGIEGITPASANSAQIAIGFHNGTATANIAVDPAGTHQVTGLRVLGFSGREASVDAVRDAMAELPGKAGFELARLGDGVPYMLSGLNTDQVLAVGSAFKLLILAELVRATNAGERQWTDMVTIDGTPLPGGAYTLAPKDTQFTLREIAAKMISISDNSATDILLRLIGRASVEKMMYAIGIIDAARNRPYLDTGAVFKLKGVAGLADRWLALDEAGRRAMLDGEIAATPLSKIDRALFKAGKPVRIEQLEWFFAPSDMVRVMDWLRRNTASGPGAEARAILAINPGVRPAAAAPWKYVGYKGGSEPGVLNMTLLLQGKDGIWYALTATWNNSTEDVNLARFAGLINRAAELAAPR